MTLPDWERELVEDAISKAERRLEAEDSGARKRALQLAREQAYHRLALAIDRPEDEPGHGQLTFFPADPTLFDEAN
ncbi:MAG: hypothetical protein ABR505_02480 [Actinomycetota bacterium]